MIQVSRVVGQTWTSIRAADAGRAPVEQLKQEWSERMLSLTGVRYKVKGTPSTVRPTIFAGNHLSYLDIPLLLTQVPQACFVAKEELGAWPVFGRAMRKADTIFVKRNSIMSRGSARVELLRAIVEERRSIAIFPSGTTRLLEDAPWKPGAFRLAEETGAPLQLFRICYSPLRRAAFVDDDGFIAHLFQLCRSGGATAELEFAPPIEVKRWRESLDMGRAWCRSHLNS